MIEGILLLCTNLHLGFSIEGNGRGGCMSIVHLRGVLSIDIVGYLIVINEMCS